MSSSFRKFRWICVLLVLVAAFWSLDRYAETGQLFPIASAAAPFQLKNSSDTRPASALSEDDAYRLCSTSVNPTNLAATMRYLSGLGSRVVGYPGNEKARDYVVASLKSALNGVGGSVTTENFTVTTPVDDGLSSVSLGGKSFHVSPLWPNLVRTSSLPIGGVQGPLIYGGQGDLSNFNGKQVSGSVVLLDFNSGMQWLNAARLGAKAILFIEPSESMRGEAESKFLSIPVNVPRFWVSRRDGAAMESQALTAPEVTAKVECNQPWKQTQAANIVGVLPGTDPVLKDQVIVVESYYDSMSVCPAISPGAESSAGVASMLEIARIFAANRPKRTVMFVATDGHYLGLQGIREFIDKHVDSWLPLSWWDKIVEDHGGPHLSRAKVYLFSALDLSSQSSGLGVFYKGHFYNFREDVQADYSDIGRYLGDNADRIGQSLGFDSSARFVDAINPKNGKNWQNFLPGSFAFDGEPAALANGKAITLATIDDDRQRVDTPGDTFDKVNIANVQQQTILLACEYWRIFNDASDSDNVSTGSKTPVFPIKDYPSWTRQGLRLGFTRLDGNALIFDPTSSFVPNKPMPAGAITVVHAPFKTMTGVRGNLVDIPAGSEFHYVGLPLVTSNTSGLGTGASFHIDAYRVSDGLPTRDDILHKTAPDPRGQIDYAPDLGPNGASLYPNDVSMTGVSNSVQVIVFNCIPTSLFDLVDQSNLVALTGIQIIDGASNGDPRQYGYAISTATSGTSSVEDVGVLFTDSNTRVKVLMSSGPDAARFLLLNSRLEKGVTAMAAAEGYGYNVANPNDPYNPKGFVVNGVITDIPLRVASDMWTLDEFRIRQLAKYRIVDQEMNTLHQESSQLIGKANMALSAQNYSDFDSLARAAWGLEARVYPRAQETASDVVKGLLFYLFLMIPFAFFVERLFVASADLKKQIVWVFGIFLLVFVTFSQIHPAFDITVNPGIVLIAFVMMALSLMVTALVWGKFEEQMSKISKATTGVHNVNVGAASVAFAAFALGISNMRRRKARTVLTCITLVLLTFTVLSFTSIVNEIHFNRVPAPGDTRYHGILLRNSNWDPLQLPAYRILRDRYAGSYPVAPRAWFQQTSIKRGSKSLDLKGVSGFAPDESKVSGIQDCLIAGRWFKPGDTYVAILPDSLASSLGVTVADVGKASVTFSGLDFTVIGIIDGDKIKDEKDLDNEPLTPADFQASAAAMASSSSSSGSGSGAGANGFQEYQHLDPQQVLYIPFDTLMNVGGTLQSVAINFNSIPAANRELMDLMPRLDLNLYAGLDRNYRFSAINSMAGTGIGNIVIPLLIAGLIVLNTMLGSVFERVKEIAIFSSIGLTPGNIGMLFIAEAMVYAVIGAVAGYLLGQGLSKLITVFNILPGLYLNFSSTSAMFATASVGAVVLLSTLYPAKKASQVATPAVDRVWKLPEPDGDNWEISLPFAITGNQAVGVNGYLAEWMNSYVEQSVGDFIVQDVQLETYEAEHGLAYSLGARIWLAPFDLGVSQYIKLRTAPTEMDEVYSVEMDVVRVSGDISNWKRVNRRFLNVVRRQYLIWRTLPAEEHERYCNLAKSAERGDSQEPVLAQ